MLRLALIPFFMSPMVEIIHLEDDKELIIVNKRCEVIVETQDILTNYSLVEKLVFEKCFPND